MENMDCDQNTFNSANDSNTNVHKKKNKRKKKNRKNSFTQRNAKDSEVLHQSNIHNTMASWVENYTKAATWQLKHQVAYWKSKALSLEYENNVLHDIIKKNNLVGAKTESSSESQSEEEVQNNSDSDEIEVSEEYIQFLIENAKYREEAKKAREKFRGYKSDEEEVNARQTEPMAEQNTEETYKELYGHNWQKVRSLEMANDSHFLTQTDSTKPCYWPNIPLNFKFV